MDGGSLHLPPGGKDGGTEADRPSGGGGPGRDLSGGGSKVPVDCDERQRRGHG